MDFSDITGIRKTVRHMHRYADIIGVFLKYGFDEIIQRLHLDRILESFLARRRTDKVDIEKYSRPERFRLALEDLGTTFIKLGQLLSTRPDLLPLDYIEEISKLQDDVPPVSFEEIRKIVETELNGTIEELFETFNPKPLAAASIGQIHEATLLTGEEVVVKVQRPNIRHAVEVDIDVLRHVAGLMEKHLEGWDVHRPTEIVSEMERMLEKELDFTVEAAHIDRFTWQTKGDDTVYVPRVYKELTTTSVLTMERVRGVKISLFDRLKQEGYDFGLLADRISALVMKQIVIEGFFHADPHPGNLFILPGEKICFVDFGMMGMLNHDLRMQFCNLLFAMSQRDEVQASEALLRLTVYDETVEINRRRLETDVAEFMTQHFYKPIKELRVGKVLQQLMEKTVTHRLRIPMDVFLMIKAVSTIEGLIRVLDPEYDILAEAKPYVRRVRSQQYNPVKLGKNVLETAVAAFEVFRNLPADTADILRLVKRGKARIAFEHHGLAPLVEAMERVSNRLAYSVVLAALIVGSSLIVHAGLPPTWNDIPMIGLAGYILAALMGFGLLLSIIKHGRM